MYQRQVAHVRLLGEAYSFRLVDSTVVFDTLHLLVAFGHDVPDTAAALDPPTSFFRIRCAARLTLS
jgi:regulator of nonsense transcripts 2